MSKRVQIAQLLEKMAAESGGTIDREGFKVWLRRMWRNNTLYQQISIEDFEYFKTKWPEERSFDHEIDRETTEWVFAKLEGIRKDANWKLFANLQKAIGFLTLNNKAIHEDAFDETVDVIIDAMCERLFE